MISTQTSFKNVTNAASLSPSTSKPEVARVVTFVEDDSLYVRESATYKFDGAIVQLWRLIAEKLQLAFEIRSIDQTVFNNNIWSKLLSCLENDTADVVMHHLTPVMMRGIDMNDSSFVFTPPFMARGMRAGKSSRTHARTHVIHAIVCSFVCILFEI